MSADKQVAGQAHTPGPWRHSAESVDPEWSVVTTSGGAVIANVNADCKQEANARLIAAAPDLLAALKQFIHLAENDTLRTSDADRESLLDALTAANAALAKAVP
jgi:hypothetical protein